MSTSTTKALRMSYQIGRGEQGVLTFEPYKSALLPYWRFRTVAIAKESSATLWEKFLEYDVEDDFVGMVSIISELILFSSAPRRTLRHGLGSLSSID